MFLLCLSLLLSPCLGADLVDTLVGRPEASTLVQLVTKAGLVDTLKGGTFTILAPTDAAFAKVPTATLSSLLTDNAALKNVLLYHVIPGNVPSSAVTDELTAATAQGGKVRFNVYSHNNVVTVNGKKISTVDVQADNGVIHFIDDVILPVDKTIVQIIAEDPELSTLLTAMTAAGVAFEFQADPRTVFAPTNAAFAALDPNDLNKLLGDKNRLEETIEYHAIKDTDFAIGLYDKEYVKSIDGAEDYIKISVGNNGVFANNGKVVAADIQATNGVIHKIDHVLIPRSVATWLRGVNVGRK